MTTILAITDDYDDKFEIAEVVGRNGRALCIEIGGGGAGSLLAEISDSAKLASIRDAIGGFLDAPRLAAREHAEVVHEDDGVRLLKTSAGEWGVRVDDGNAPSEFRVGWCSDEESARRAFDAECEKVTCEDCEQRVPADDAHDAGDCYLCDDCHEKAVEVFKVTRYRCTDAACGWTGMGPETGRDGDGVPECPRCEEYVEEVGEEPAEAPAP